MSRQVESQGPDMDRILHRETHSSRAVVATAAAVLVIGLAAYGLLEAAVHAIGQPAWLIEPQVAAERLVALPAGISPLLLGAIGGVLAMFGLVFSSMGFCPGAGPVTFWVAAGTPPVLLWWWMMKSSHPPWRAAPGSPRTSRRNRSWWSSRNGRQK